MTFFGIKGLSPEGPSDIRRILTAILLLMPLLPQPPASAQGPWHLDSCIGYALQHNLRLKDQAIEISDRKAQLVRSTLGLLPSVNAQVVRDYNWGRSVDMQELTITRDKLTTATGLSLEGAWTLFGGLSAQNERLAVKETVREAEAEREHLRRALVADVTRSYLNLMLAKQILTYARESEATIERQCERTRSLVEAGSQPKSALSEMEAQVASERARVVEASCNVRSATLSLMQLMNYPPGDDGLVVAEGFDDRQFPAARDSLDDLQIEAMAVRDPRIEAARARVSRMKHQVAAGQGAALPRLAVTASYGTFASSTSDEDSRKQLGDNRNPSVSLSLTVPLFNFGETAIRLKRSRLALQKAVLAREQMQIEVSDEIRAAVIEADNCSQKCISALETLKAASGALEVTEAKYNLGASTALDYIVARNNHFKAISDLLQARWQYMFQLKMLDYYRQ